MAGRTLDNLRSRYGGVGDRPAQGAAPPPRHGGPGRGPGRGFATGKPQDAKRVIGRLLSYVCLLYTSVPRPMRELES